MMNALKTAALSALLWASTSPAAPAPRPLAELAAQADLVALAQVRDTDYRTRRGIPVSGSGYLRVLIPYKGAVAEQVIEVFEKGVHEAECYFPNPTVFEEGRRYLLFLRRDPSKPQRYRGLPEGCALDVLVDADNGYALRFPLSGMEISDSLAERAREMTFADPYAVVADADLLPSERSPLQSGGFIVAEPADGESPAVQSGSLAPPATHSGPRWRYTHGIPLTEFSPLLELDR